MFKLKAITFIQFGLLISVLFILNKLFNKNEHLNNLNSTLETRITTLNNQVENHVFNSWKTNGFIIKDKDNLFSSNCTASVFLIISDGMCSPCIQQNVNFLKMENAMLYNKIIYVYGLNPLLVKNIYSIPNEISIYKLKNDHYSKLENPYWGLMNKEGDFVTGYVASKNNEKFNQIWWHFIKYSSNDGEK